MTELRRAINEAVTDEMVQAIMRKVTRMALEGNLHAAKLVLERVCGRAPEAAPIAEPLTIASPRLRTAADCNASIEIVVRAVCDGTVNRDAAKILIDAIHVRLKAIETTEFEQRLAELEASAAQAEARAEAKNNEPDPRFT